MEEEADKGRKGGRECFLFLAAGDLCARNRIAPGNEMSRASRTLGEGKNGRGGPGGGDLRETFSHDLLVPRKIGDMARTPLGKTRSLPLQCLAEVLEVKIKEGTSCQDEQYGTLPRVFRDRKSLRQ